MNDSAAYRKGYREGYLPGYKKALEHCCQTAQPLTLTEEETLLPIEALGFSTRALNCLQRAGCTCLGDVCALSEFQIATMRNLGVKTAAEIAEVLTEHGLLNTYWTKYRIYQNG